MRGFVGVCACVCMGMGVCAWMQILITINPTHQPLQSPDLATLLGHLTSSKGQLITGQQQTQEVQQNVLYMLARSSTGLGKVAQGLKPPLFSGEKDSVELDTWLFQVKNIFKPCHP